ncbi:MAG: 3-hydroxyacyl-CoA dehydrogenase NAD-binding domain-containing protein [Nannocystaceae bacterium]|nr:3-hydroxyacyl-CoA dehydrogenase NAD-binding domain-containing protein [bacterium]
MTTTENQTVRLDFDATSGVATLTLAMPKVNRIDAAFGVGLSQALDWAQSQDGLTGIIIDTAHDDFCVGADLDTLFPERDASALLERVRSLGALYRRLETLGVPVVAALTGSALGGGYELALACHHRIALDDARIQVGLPEVTLGVLPGAGGTQRLPRLIGIQAGLDVILQGKILRAPKAKAAGLIDALASDRDALRAAALAFIAANAGAQQPWDRKGRMPGPRPGSADARNLFMAACGMLEKKTAGAYAAPRVALATVQEGLAVRFDRALEIEARAFVELAISDQAKDMIRTLWFHRNAVKKHADLPRAESDDIQKVSVLGAGMMGAGLAFVCAKAGYDVVLRDINPETIETARAHCAAQAAKLKHLDDEARSALLGRINATVDLEPVRGSDLIIEAVFEDIDLKHKVIEEAEPLLAPGGIWASNTSALPIGDLAKVSRDRGQFIGQHYFSPVEKMELLEIVVGAETNESALARSLAFSRRIGKLPIVVGDGYGFYTTRVFSAYILEGAQLVAEGHDPVLVEWAAKSAGMVVAPLQVFDEVTLTLGTKAVTMGRKYGRDLDTEGVALVESLVAAGRKGKAAGAGFYEYADGRRRGLWKGLADLAKGPPAHSSVELLRDRLLGIQALEAARAVAEGVIMRRRDAEVGAIFGIGFAPGTGGPLSYIDRMGAKAFVERMDAFADQHGNRWAVPRELRTMADSGDTFFPPV